MNHWWEILPSLAPLLQTLAWIAFFAALLLSFRDRFFRLIAALEQRILRGSSVKIGPGGIEVGALEGLPIVEAGAPPDEREAASDVTYLSALEDPSLLSSLADWRKARQGVYAYRQRFDRARAFVHYADQADATIWRRMRDACVDLATVIGGRGIQPEDRHEVGSTWHDAGTLFMGDDPGFSVTDTSGHFHHVGNAVCVDQALFPTVGSANPVLTGLCLARKAAETIVARHVSEPPPGDAQIAAERAEGFVFLLEGDEAAKWRPNDPRFTAARPALIENGAIVEVHGDVGLGVLVYDDPAPFGDFELRLQWKAFRDPTTGVGLANSGVFLRAPSPPAELDDENFYDRAIEIQIDDTGYDPVAGRFRSPLHRTGTVYKHAPARVHAAKTPSADGTTGFWNEYRITARRSRISVRLNDRLASDGDVPPSLTAPGLVGLQYHSGKVQFRAIRIRRL